MPAEKVNLVIDARERAIYQTYAAELAGIEYRIDQITTGDYAVVAGDTILAIIERKSLQDFAASFKDGRAANRQKLIALRERTGCRVIYLIEGRAFPKPTDRFGGIPWAAIESSIFHLIVRDNVSIIWTKDMQHTAQTLARFVKSMDSLLAKGEEVNEMHVPAAEGAGRPADVTELDEAAQEAMQADINALLHAKHTKSDLDILRELWACFPGITVETADVFLQNFALIDILEGRVAPNTISELRQPNGRRILTKAVKSLVGIDRSQESRLLTTIPGISAATAGDLLKVERLSGLLGRSIADLAALKVGRAKKILGQEKAARIKKYFGYRFKKAPEADEVVKVDLNPQDLEAVDAFMATL